MKKFTKMTLSLLALIILGLLVPIFFSYKEIRKVLIQKEVFSQSENVQKSYRDYAPIQCKFGFNNPEYAFVSYLHYIYPEDDVDMQSWNIGFYDLSRPHIFSQNWNIQRTGGTTVKNTTFPELVKMVKEDCAQFQADYNNPDSNGIDWGYREAEPPESPKTEEELEEDAKRDFFEQVRGMKYIFSEVFTDYQQEKFSEMYGDINSMTDDEIFSIKKSINENGGLEVVFKEYLFDENGNVIFRKQEE